MNKLSLTVRLVICLTFTLGTNSSALAQDFPPEGDARLQFANISYEELCNIDSKFCEKLVTADGHFKEPKKTILVVFQRFRKKLQEIADRFGVDPRLIAAVVTTEHTLNVQIDEVIAQGLSQTELGSDGQIGIFNFSYGFGQIYESAARDAEVIVAEFEQREQLSAAEISARLKTFEGALTYAAALLVNAERIYAEHGFQIGNQPGVLATLYNLGRDRTRAAEAQRLQRLPRINYFGWFVEHNWDKFTKIMNEEIPTFRLHSNDYTNERVVAEGNLSYIVRKDHLPVYFLQEPAPLFVAPDKCHTEDSSETLASDYREVLNREMKPKANAGVGNFNIFQESIDCHGEPWALARFSEGNLGWLRHSDVIDSMDFRYTPRSCAQKAYDSCLAEVRSIVGEEAILDFNDLDGIVAIQLVGFNESKSVDFTSFQENCYEDDWRENSFEKFYGEESKLEKFIEEAKNGYISFRRDDVDRLERFLKSQPSYVHFYNADEIADISAKIERAREVLLSRPELGYAREENNFNSQSIYVQMMAWTKSFQYHCQSSCIGPRPQVLHSFFFDFTKENLTDLEFITHRIDKFRSLPLRPEDRTPLGRGWSYDTDEDQWRFISFQSVNASDLLEMSYAQFSPGQQETEIRQVCSALTKLNPQIDALFSEYFRTLRENENEEYYNDLALSPYHLMRLLGKCDVIGQYLQAKSEGKAYSGAKSLFDSGLSNIEINGEEYPLWLFPLLELNAEEITNIVSQEIHTLLKDLEFLIQRGKDHVVFLNAIRQGDLSVLDDPNNRVRGMKLPQNHCAYNPIESIERIDALLKLECVEQVLVPNEKYLVKNFGTPEHDGTVKVMEKRDRVEFTLNPNCEDEGMDGQMIRSGLY